MIERFGDINTEEYKKVELDEIPKQYNDFESAFSWLADRIIQKTSETRERYKKICPMELFSKINLQGGDTDRDPFKIMQYKEVRLESVEDIFASIEDFAHDPIQMLEDVKVAVGYNLDYERSHDMPNIFCQKADRDAMEVYYGKLENKIKLQLPFSELDLKSGFCQTCKYIMFFKDLFHKNSSKDSLLNQLYGEMSEEYYKGRTLLLIRDACQNDSGYCCTEDDRWLFEKITGIGAVINLDNILRRYNGSDELVQILLSFSDEIFMCKPVLYRMQLTKLVEKVIDALLRIDPNTDNSEKLFNQKTFEEIKNKLKSAVEECNRQYLILVSGMMHLIKEGTVPRVIGRPICVAADRRGMGIKVRLQPGEPIQTDSQRIEEESMHDLLFNGYDYDLAIKERKLASRTINSKTRRASSEEKSYARIQKKAIEKIFEQYGLNESGGY